MEKLSVIRWYTWFFSVVSTGSNPADTNRFRSHTRNRIINCILALLMQKKHYLKPKLIIDKNDSLLV